jgi:hypothetical protein
MINLAERGQLMFVVGVLCHLLAIDLLSGGYICYDKSNTWWRSNGSSILCSCQHAGMERRLVLTLSPKPHMRARRGCCTTWSLEDVSGRNIMWNNNLRVLTPIRLVGTRLWELRQRLHPRLELGVLRLHGIKSVLISNVSLLVCFPKYDCIWIVETSFPRSRLCGL